MNDGIQIESPENYMLPMVVSEVFFRKLYTPSDFSVEPNDIIVDIGAGVGEFSLFAANSTQNTVYAFEPSPKNFEFLERNIRRNSFRNIIAHNVAVSDNIGSARLFLASSGVGHLLFDHDDHGPLRDYIEVPTTTLESIIEHTKMEQIDILKMDCEGSEGAILMSTPIKYLTMVKKIVLEFHDHVSILNHNQIMQLLDNLGFTTELDWADNSLFGYIYGRRTM